MAVMHVNVLDFMLPPLCGRRQRGADSVTPSWKGESRYDPSGSKSIPKTEPVTRWVFLASQIQRKHYALCRQSTSSIRMRRDKSRQGMAGATCPDCCNIAIALIDPKVPCVLCTGGGQSKSKPRIS